MGIKNAVQKTIAYQKRNGTRAAFFAALERVSDNIHDKYQYVPLSEEVLLEQKREYKLLAEAGNCVRFSIVVPLFNTPEKYLKEMIESVINQTYGDWELVLADASMNTSDIALEYAKEDPRIKYYHLDKNGGISENTNRGIEKATGDYIGLLDHDDLLTPDALYEVSRVIRKSMKQNRLSRYQDCPIRLIYSDEDKFDGNKYYEHHAKPSFNMDYLMSNNYICHFAVMRADVIKRLKLRAAFDGAQDFDLFLRATAEATLEMPMAAGQIVHISKVLYHWRCHKDSTAANPASKTYAYDAGKKALADLMKRYKIEAEVEMLQHLGFYRINYIPDIFAGRKDVGCVGGKVLNKKGRIVGGAYTKDKNLMYANLPEGYSGGLQHRAVLQQDCAAVDLRCISVRPELIPLYEQVTGIKYVDAYGEAIAMAKIASESGKRGTTQAADERFKSLDQQEIVNLSFKLCEEIKKKGYRIVWDPRAVQRIS
ncbi:glycosyltransferase family 2 protein [Butyrivibrio sp. VCB2006]|uniref:glycosyltransferase family 2 protein n=1 Tax=Butyrivibrio sp. VCB2006 TaxID=1280679 RepID=UPI00042537CA|nr:glycosyltransferase [Butyrivibrio sp. VCB2006]